MRKKLPRGGYSAPRGGLLLNKKILCSGTCVRRSVSVNFTEMLQFILDSMPVVLIVFVAKVKVESLSPVRNE